MFLPCTTCWVTTEEEDVRKLLHHFVPVDAASFPRLSRVEDVNADEHTIHVCTSFNVDWSGVSVEGRSRKPCTSLFADGQHKNRQEEVEKRQKQQGQELGNNVLPCCE